MTTNITGNMYDTILSLAPGETVTINDLQITNTEDKFVRLHLNHNHKRGTYRPPSDRWNELDRQLTPQGATFEQQWER